MLSFAIGRARSSYLRHAHSTGCIAGGFGEKEKIIGKRGMFAQVVACVNGINSYFSYVASPIQPRLGPTSTTSTTFIPINSAFVIDIILFSMTYSRFIVSKMEMSHTENKNKSKNPHNLQRAQTASSLLISLSFCFQM
jgi:hypothetical protein